ncbi:MAG: diacylglycerol kinase family protein, partial [Patescibacteria group bacterium]|nr:diacylglycerol kinase family protein [Patescibacteria group bacterium]
MINFKRLIKSFKYAFKGLRKTFKEEQNLKIQAIAACAVLVFAVYFNITRTEWMFLIFVIGLVILMEIANSAVERVTDVLKPRIHDYVKEIKDITAAGVMVASFIALIIGAIIFLPYII